MRQKSKLGVADGINFDDENLQSDSTKAVTKPAEIDPNRKYSKYYTPKPKTGAKGGTLGRGAVSERKIQFSVTCTQAQKDLFKEAAKKDHRRLPEFICLAIEEYIENHNLK